MPVNQTKRPRAPLGERRDAAMDTLNALASSGWDLGLALVLGLGVLLVVTWCGRFLFVWLGHYPLLAVVVTLIYLVLFGVLGQEYGLQSALRPPLDSTDSGNIVLVGLFFSGCIIPWILLYLFYMTLAFDKKRETYSRSRIKKRVLEASFYLRLDRIRHPVQRWFRPTPIEDFKQELANWSRTERRDEIIRATRCVTWRMSLLAILSGLLDLAFFASNWSLETLIGILPWAWISGILAGYLLIYWILPTRVFTKYALIPLMLERLGPQWTDRYGVFAVFPLAMLLGVILGFAQNLWILAATLLILVWLFAIQFSPPLKRSWEIFQKRWVSPISPRLRRLGEEIRTHVGERLNRFVRWIPRVVGRVTTPISSLFRRVPRGGVPGSHLESPADQPRRAVRTRGGFRHSRSPHFRLFVYLFFFAFLTGYAIAFLKGGFLLSFSLYGVLLGMVMAVGLLRRFLRNDRRTFAVICIVLLWGLLNGTDWSPGHLLDEYKIRFQRVGHQAVPNLEGSGSAKPPLDYYQFPVALDSREYLDRGYVRQYPINAVEFESYITSHDSASTSTYLVTSAHKHRLRPFDVVKIRGVRGLARVNGSFVVKLSDERPLPDNQFRIIGVPSAAPPDSEEYEGGGDWSLDTEVGLITSVRKTQLTDSILVITSPNHHLVQDAKILLLDFRNEPYSGTHANPILHTVSRILDSQRFQVTLTRRAMCDDTHRLEGGHWRESPSARPLQGKGGVTKVVHIGATTWHPWPHTILTSRNHGLGLDRISRIVIEEVRYRRVVKPWLGGLYNHVVDLPIAFNEHPNGVQAVLPLDSDHLIVLTREDILGQSRNGWKTRLQGELLPWVGWIDSQGQSAPAGSNVRVLSWSGFWSVDEDRGRIYDVHVPGNGQIRLTTSQPPSLKVGDHLALWGIQGVSQANGVFSIVEPAPDPNPDSGNGQFTIQAIEPSSRSARLEQAPTTQTDPRNRTETANPSYLGGGEWRKVQDRGRGWLDLSTKPFWTVHSPAHGLKPGDRVRLSGIGLFTIKEDPDAPKDAFLLGPPRLAESDPATTPWKALEESQASRTIEWQRVDDSGPIDWASKQVKSLVRIHSTNHGLVDGDHVRLVGQPWSKATFVYAVKQTEEDAFELEGTQNVSLNSLPVNSGKLIIPGAEWFRVVGLGGVEKLERWSKIEIEILELLDTWGWSSTTAMRGICQTPQSTLGEILVTSTDHGLQDNDFIGLAVTDWTDAKGYFQIARVDKNRFTLIGTRDYPCPSADKADTTSAVPMLGSWRRAQPEAAQPGQMRLAAGYRFVQGSSEKLENPVPGHWNLAIHSPGHKLKTNDCIRLYQAPLIPSTRKINTLLESTETARVLVETKDVFVIRIDKFVSWNHITLCLDQPSPPLVLRYRPIDDRGVIDGGKIAEVPGSAKQGDAHRDDSTPRRLEIKASGHHLSKGSRIWLTGRVGEVLGVATVMDPPSGPAQDPNAFSLPLSGEQYQKLLVERIDVESELCEEKVARWTIAGQISNGEALENWRDLQHTLIDSRHHREPKAEKDATEKSSKPDRASVQSTPSTQHPKLVIVTVSGGGIRSSIWTLRVLSELERRIPGITSNIRLVTGASGGMVGAAAYVSALEPPARDHHPSTTYSQKLDLLIKQFRGGMLPEVVAQLVFGDIPSMYWPFRTETDRGEVLEAAWIRHTDRLGPGSSPLARPFRTLGIGEWTGWRPSLIFTPMCVEDGRRVFISNLELDFAPRNYGYLLLPDGDRKISSKGRSIQSDVGDYYDIFSLSAIEFFRLFPKADDFRVSTGARMSAAFPLVSPAVALPTNPPRRIVDAGYYDNYGVNLAAVWMFEVRDWLSENTSGVVIVQIRDWQGEKDRRELRPETIVPRSGLARTLRRQSAWIDWACEQGETLGHRIALGYEWLTSPLKGAETSRRAMMSYRNDEQLEVLSNLLNTKAKGSDRFPGVGFFTTVVFECPKEVSLSWSITAREFQDIMNGFNTDWSDLEYSEAARKNVQRLDELVDWWSK